MYLFYNRTKEDLCHKMFLTLIFVTITSCQVRESCTDADIRKDIQNG